MNVRNLRIGKERPEVMEPIERAVLDMYTSHPELKDREVDAAFGSLIMHYLDFVTLS